MRLLLLALLICPLLLVAEEKKRPLTAAEVRSYYSDPTNRIVTDWTTEEEDTKRWRSFTSAGYDTVLTEGKLENGEVLYRKAYKHVDDVYPGAARPKWFAYNGVDEEFFETTNRKLLKENYTLMQMQRFENEDGEFRFCATWVRFLPTPIVH
ncbi:hypothetical protein AYO49_00320 [Verrucomicrobiaceae bacterium SCGC AG-212-N21]|nr:hypothetical protein AYO49_00320 [Verrucomicrobiaceae bacterium SCGC AG-212-N21]